MYRRVSNFSSSGVLNPEATPPSNGIMHGLKYDKNLSDSWPWSSLCWTARPPRAASSSTVLIAAVPASSYYHKIIKKKSKKNNSQLCCKSLNNKTLRKPYLGWILANPKMNVIQVRATFATRGLLQTINSSSKKHNKNNTICLMVSSLNMVP